MDSNNVLELLRAQVLQRNDELPPHVFLDPTGHADTTGGGMMGLVPPE